MCRPAIRLPRVAPARPPAQAQAVQHRHFRFAGLLFAPGGGGIHGDVIGAGGNAEHQHGQHQARHGRRHADRHQHAQQRQAGDQERLAGAEASHQEGRHRERQQGADAAAQQHHRQGRVRHVHAFGQGRDAAGPGTHDHAEQGEDDGQGILLCLYENRAARRSVRGGDSADRGVHFFRNQEKACASVLSESAPLCGLGLERWRLCDVSAVRN